MKKKFKLFATIGSLALAICMMTIGVLAANTVTLNVSSTVSFAADSVYANFEGKVAGAATGNTTVTAQNYTTLQDPSAATFTGTGITGGEWAVSNVTFGEENTEITYTFKFTNKTPDKNLQVNVVDNTTADTGITVDKNGDDFDLTTDGDNGEVTYTLTLTLTDVSKSVNATVDIEFTLTAVARS